MLFQFKITLKALKILLLISGFLFIENAESFYIKELNASSGLLNKHIKGFAKDEFGFIWIGTENGLVRYDGSELKTFDISLLFNDYQSENRVLWVVQTGKNEVFFEMNGGKQYQARGNSIVPIAADRHSEINAFRLNSSVANLKPDKFKICKDVFLQNDNVNIDILELSILGRKSIFLNKQFGFSAQRDVMNNFFKINDSSIYFFDDQLSLYKVGNNGVESKQYYLPKNIKFGKHTHYRAYWNLNTKSSYIRVDDCLYKVVEKNGDIHLVLITDKLNIPYDIYELYFDEVNDVVFISSHDGIFEYREIGNKHKNISLLKTGGECTLQQIDSNTLFTQNGKFVDLKGLILKRTKGMDQLFVYASVVDRYNNLYATGVGGLIYCNSKKIYDFKNFDPNVSDEVRVAFVDDLDRLWVCYYHHGIYVYEHNKDGSLKKLIHQFKSVKKVIAYNLQENTLFVMSQDGWLRSIELNSFKCQNLLKDDRIAIVRNAYKIDSKRVLCATYGAGLLVIENNKIIQLAYDKKNYTRYSSCIIERAPGIYLITTNYGLLEIKYTSIVNYCSDNKNKLSFKYYDQNNGLPESEFNGGCTSCGIKLKNRKIALPTISGIILIDTSFFKKHTVPLKIHIDEFLIDQSLFKVHDTLKLNSIPKVLAIKFSVPYFGYREDIQISLVLNGSKINAVNSYFKENYLEISHLQPGENKIEIIAQIEQITTIKTIFVYCPFPWYFQWQYWFLIVLGLVAIVVVMVWVYNKQLIRKNRQLDRVIKERTLTIQNNLLELKDKNIHMKRLINHKNNIVSMMSHDILGPLKFSTLVLDDASAKLQDVEQKETIDDVSESIKRIMGMSKDVLYWSYSLNDNSQLQTSDFNVLTLLDEKSKYFSSIYKNKKNKIQYERKDFKVVSDKNIISIALNNVLENAIKYGKSHLIEIQYGEATHHSYISVQNSGSSISSELVDAINRGLYIEQFDSRETYEKGGIGLRISIELLKMINGNIQVEVDEMHDFTKFIVNF